MNLIPLLETDGVGAQKSGIDEDGIGASVLIDCDQRKLAYWAVDESKPREHYEKIWSGWNVVDLGEDYRAFENMCSDSVRFDDQINVSQALNWIRCSNHHLETFHCDAIDETTLEEMIQAYCRLLHIDQDAGDVEMSAAEIDRLLNE